MPVSAALKELGITDMDAFSPALVAQKNAALMFEVMEARSFVEAKRVYDSASWEEQPKLARESPMVALVQEMTYEAGIAKVRQRKAAQSK